MHTHRNSRNITGPLLLIAAGLLLLSFSIWQMVLRPSLGRSGYRSPLAADNESANIQVKEARQAFDRSQAIFLDLRDSQAYERSHVSGAINIPQDEIGRRLEELDRNRWVILYTGRGEQDAVAKVAQGLLRKGFNRATPLIGGFEAWLEAGNPIEP